ncbi:P-type cation-transporting ATPase [Fonsecaea pedrosoi]|nr:P-type cation-transporting ATPase [Fonsecaea pedrosoi]
MDSNELDEKTTCHTGCDHTHREAPSHCEEIRTSEHVHGGEAHEHAHGEDGTHLDEPCHFHLKAAMEKYATYLESAQCICRSILSSARRIETCRPYTAAGDASAVTATRSHHLNVREHWSALSRRQFKRMPDDIVRTGAEAKCCGSPESIDHVDCEHGIVPKQALEDVEKAAGLSHILLSVTGMDCSGCANNLTRALRAAGGTRDVKVTFISGTAEFCLDAEVNTLDNVIRSAQRATGYKLARFSSDTQIIDVVMSATSASIFCNNLPPGVERCDRLSKTTYEISYDPCIIGARALLAGADGQLGPPRSNSYLDEGKRRLIRITALTTTAFILTTPVVVLEWGRPSGVSEHTTLIVAVILATMVQAIAISEFYIPAMSALIYNKVVEMDMLVVISITAAYGYSIIAAGFFFAGIDLETKPFFETSTLLVTLILLGRLLAAWARKRAVQAVSLRSLQTSTALLIDPITEHALEIDARLLQYGDRISILPHSRIVTDADVLGGASEVDESMLTGESMPVSKTIGDYVVSGTINGGGRLTARVSRLPGRNTITDIANLVEQAQSFKPRVQDLADKVAGYFVPVVCTVALVVLIVWILVGLRIHQRSAGGAIGTAIGYAIAVLAISCPCALGLAVPMVLVVAGGVAARGGVIIKTADVIQRGFRVTDVIFDKTGTLTEPRLQVVKELTCPTEKLDRDTLLPVIMKMVRSNKHPVSEAVAQTLDARGVGYTELDGVMSIPGCGLQAQWQGLTVRAGNTKWLEIGETPEVAEVTAEGLTVFGVTVDGQLAAVFGLKSQVREGAVGTIQELYQRQITVHIVSGDGRRVVEGVAADLSIPLDNIAAEQTPAQKQEYVRRLMDAGKITLFCGDGTNDAVAVAQANVGVQIESSSDVTRATADVILLRNLDGVVNLLDVSKAAFRRIVFNFVWSAAYNMLAILLAAGAFVKVRIPPAYAGLGEIVSVLPVIVVALTQPKVKGRN